MYVMDFTQWKNQRCWKYYSSIVYFRIWFRIERCLTTSFKLQMFTFDVSSQDSLCTSIQLSPVSKLNTKYYKYSDKCCTLICLINVHAHLKFWDFFTTLHVSNLNTKYYKHSYECCTFTCLINEQACLKFWDYYILMYIKKCINIKVRKQTTLALERTVLNQNRLMDTNLILCTSFSDFTWDT